MAIAKISSGSPRRSIGFARSLPDAPAVELFKDRGYDCYLLTDQSAAQAGTLEKTDSIVLSYRKEKPSELGDLRRFAYVLNYDCRIYLRYESDLATKKKVIKTIDLLKLPVDGLQQAEMANFSSDWFDPYAPPFGPYLHVRTADDDWTKLANLIVANPAGHPPNPSLTIKPKSVVKKLLSAESVLLLRRAFADCSSVELFQKTDGLSGVLAFEVFAHIRDKVSGAKSPYRCFIKLGPRLKVAREYDKYRTIAMEKVPFHLGPRLRLDRCMLGQSQGIITCDFVAGAEPIRDCVKAGRGIHALGNLFNQTLIAWRRDAEPEQQSLNKLLVNYLADREEVPKHRKKRIKDFGAKRSLAELIQRIQKSPLGQRVLIGTIHGDLHATNVLVRMGDAIIIDLENIATAKPLLLDAASLEAGLFIDGFVGDKRTGRSVLKSVLPYYTRDALTKDDHFCDPADKSVWFIDSIRQIRMQSKQMELGEFQYAWTLVAVFLRKSLNKENLDKITKPAEGLTREDVRALAYVLAEKMIMTLSNSA